MLYVSEDSYYDENHTLVDSNGFQHLLVVLQVITSEKPTAMVMM